MEPQLHQEAKIDNLKIHSTAKNHFGRMILNNVLSYSQFLSTKLGIHEQIQEVNVKIQPENRLLVLE